MIELPGGVRLYPSGSERGGSITYLRSRRGESARLSGFSDHLLLLINLQGNVQIRRGGHHVEVGAEEVSFVATTRQDIEISFNGGAQRRILIEVERGRLGTFLKQRKQVLESGLARWLEGDGYGLGPTPPRKLSRFDLEGIEYLIRPPITENCLELWYHGKMIEMLTHYVFSFGQRPRNKTAGAISQDQRIPEVMLWLRQHFHEDITLDRLASVVGCSSTYLSRQFKKETGNTISAFLRRVRMEQAAEYLKRGTHNVTEAAYDVGYSSLGQFSNA
ncbi:MAG: AraC family transcriptional regulator, partial [Verrucomicrobiota bacterium]